MEFKDEAIFPQWIIHLILSTLLYKKIIIEKLLSQIQESINKEQIIGITLFQILISPMESNLTFLVILDLHSLMEFLV